MRGRVRAVNGEPEALGNHGRQSEQGRIQLELRLSD
jgi:hypothetical protein